MDQLHKRLVAWKNKRKYPLALLSAVDLEALRAWPAQRESLFQSLMITAGFVTLQLMTMSLSPSTAPVYCLSTLALSYFLWQRLQSNPDSDRKASMAAIGAGFLSLMHLLPGTYIQERGLFCIFALQMVIYAVAAANEGLNWVLEKCF